jgi:hypothetical protein
VLLRARGIKLEATEGGVRYRSPRELASSELSAIRDHRLSLMSLLMREACQLDETLPDELYIAPHCPNTVAAITLCVDSQRIRSAA